MFDRRNTGTVTIGGTTATAVQVGRSGQSVGFFGTAPAVVQTSGAKLAYDRRVAAGQPGDFSEEEDTDRHDPGHLGPDRPADTTSRREARAAVNKALAECARLAEELQTVTAERDYLLGRNGKLSEDVARLKRNVQGLEATLRQLRGKKG